MISGRAGTRLDRGVLGLKLEEDVLFVARVHDVLLARSAARFVRAVAASPGYGDGHLKTSLRLDNTELRAFLGEEPHTPLDQALRVTLSGLGCVPAELSHSSDTLAELGWPAMAKDVSSAVLTLNSGARIPQVGLGVWQSSGKTKSAVLSALQTGYRHVDTAAVYGNEAQVGAAIAESGLPREQIFVTSKLWNKDQGYDQALLAFDASMKRLKLEYLDLYLIHWPVPKLRLESWRAFERLLADERVRSIGVSNFLSSHLEELQRVAKVLPAVNQIELSPFLQRRETVASCRKLGITLAAYSPLTRGQRLTHPVVVELAQQLGRSPAQILLRWGIEHGFVILPKSVTPSRIEENAKLFDFSLDAAAMSRLDALEEGLVTGWDPATEA
jgi:diketogulonate reductase-like aldo/keto reductase